LILHMGGVRSFMIPWPEDWRCGTKGVIEHMRWHGIHRAALLEHSESFCFL
jgi:hypothetical protein